MEMGRNGSEDQDKALAELARLICDHLLQDSSVMDSGTRLDIHLGSADFRERMSMIVAQAIADMPKEGLLAIVMGKARLERRLSDLPVLADDDMPPGFSSN
jgi:hypothetical protein